MSTDLETLLKRQPLRAPSRSLDRSVERLLAQPPAAQTDWRWRVFGWSVGVAMAASLIIAGSMAFAPLTTPVTSTSPVAQRPAPAPSQGGLASATESDRPIEIEEVWSELVPGEMAEIGGQAMRSYELQQVQHKRWVDPKNNVQIEMTVPVSTTLLTSLIID